MLQTDEPEGASEVPPGIKNGSVPTHQFAQLPNSPRSLGSIAQIAAGRAATVVVVARPADLRRDPAALVDIARSGMPLRVVSTRVRIEVVVVTRARAARGASHP